MSFIQIIEHRTKRPDEVQALDYQAATKGKSKVRRSIVAQDRNDPERYLVFAFFDSYEEAMENSNLPETAAFAEQMAALLEGPPTFHDLDVISDDAY
jgi:hypothetical protein